jgi:cellulose synthase (UDP-forming)
LNPFLASTAEGVTWGIVISGLLLAVLPWLDRNSAARIIPLALVIVLTLKYAFWRVTETLPLHGTATDLGFGVLFLALEVAAIASGILNFVTLMRWRDRTPDVEHNLPAFETQPEHPLVDVFICTYNEDAAILERTIMSATGLDYPNFRVWVLDDTCRSWLRQLAADLDCNYLDRPDNKGAKAGNINHALRHVQGLAQKPDFIAILDADFIPTSHFLSRTMSLFRAPKIGIVQTPQHFINHDPIQTNLRIGDLWPDEQRFFFDIVQPSKDAWGTSLCCGTSSVIRVSALDLVGGFPTESVTEDYLLSLRLKRFGYRTVYLNERLSNGLAPESLDEYMRQRRRWCLGFMQIIRSPDGPLRFGNGLSIMDRIGLIDSFLFWTVSYMFRIACVLVPILFLVFGIQVVDASFEDGLANFLPCYLAQIVVIAWVSDGRVLPVLTDISQLLVSRQILISVFVGLFRPHGHKFAVTAKGLVRGEVIINWRGILIMSTLLLLTIFGVLLTFLQSSTSLLDSSAVALFWSWYNIVMLLTAIVCCIEQPRPKLRERLSWNEPIKVTTDGHVLNTTTIDLSIGGIRFDGAIAAPVGAPLTLRFAGKTLDGTVMRKSATDTAVRLDETIETRTLMVRKIYSAPNLRLFEHLHAGRLASRVARRIME